MVARELRPGWWTLAWFAAWGYVVILLAVR